MKVSDAIALSKWVGQQKGWVMQTNPTMKEIRSKAEAMLGFKCAGGPISDCMREHKIPARRSKAETERQLLLDQIEDLNELIFDLVAHGSIPPGMLMKFKDRRSNLNARVMDCLNRHAKMEESLV